MSKMDKYPWIDFSVDLRSLPFKTWIQLGECVSKCEHISNIPLQPNLSDELHKVYLVKGVKATTAIEGNSLTEEEVRLRIENNLKLPPSKEYLGKEIDNIVTVYNEIKNAIQEKENHLISADKIRKYNKIILNDIPLPDHVIPGKFRKYSVVVGPYRAPDYSDVPDLMEKLCNWLNGSNFVIDKELPVVNSIVKAIIAHLYLEWIHPFGDGNGRVGRVLEFAILLASGVPSPAVHLLSNHYNATRNDYYRQLDYASKNKDVSKFISYAVQGLLDGLREQLNYIFNFVMGISWESFVYETLGACKWHEGTTRRRRMFVLGLSRQTSPVQKKDLIAINADIVEAYRNKTIMTLERDLKELEALDLIERKDDSYIAKKEKIRAFLPLKV